MCSNLTPWRILTHPVYLIAFGFGTGLSRYAPGTCGTLLAIPLYLLICRLSPVYYGAILMMAVLLGVWVCGVTERALGRADHPGIVWDEICGYGLSLVAMPPSMLSIILAFLFFRFFDIYKPWPINWIDRHLSGGWAIMLDDLAAAGYAWLLLRGFASYVLRF